MNNTIDTYEKVVSTIVYLSHYEWYAIFNNKTTGDYINTTIEQLYSLYMLLETRFNFIINIISFSAQQINLIYTCIIIFVLFIFAFKNNLKYIYKRNWNFYIYSRHLGWDAVRQDLIKWIETSYLVSWFYNIIILWYSLIHNPFSTYFDTIWSPISGTIRSYFPLLYFYTMFIFFF